MFDVARLAPEHDQVITTKLCMPRQHPNLLSRMRLVERLNQGMRRKLTLISAPAGFGKTTVLVSWIDRVRACEGSTAHALFAWVSLDAADNNGMRFWAHILAAFDRVRPGLGAQVYPLLRTAQPPPVESMLTQLINTVAPQGDVHDQQPFVLVLDDYHIITAEPIHRAIAFLLEHLPPNLHLVIATRSDPPLPLARMRLRGELLELRAADLRFTRDELTAFFEQTIGVRLATKDLAALEQRTEGWAAALQAAALSMHGRQDPSGLIHALTGSHRYIMEYLIAEVLERLPERERTFLLQTSILERLHGSLVEAVTGQHGGQAMLERLEADNLFIVPLDDERRWYRYYSLFRDVLRHQLQQEQAGNVNMLYRHASTWYAQHGRIGEAIPYSLRAEEYERAAELVEQIAGEMLLSGAGTTLLGWLEQLPAELVRCRPGLSLACAWAYLWAGRLHAVEPLLHNTVDGAPGEVLEHIRVIRACVASCRAEKGRALEQARQALEQISPERVDLRATSAALIAMNLEWAPAAGVDIEEPIRLLGAAVADCQAAGYDRCALLSLSQLPQVLVAQGQLHRAAESIEQALRLTAEQAGRLVPLAGKLYVTKGLVLCEWNRLDEAARWTLEGIRLAQAGRDPSALGLGVITLARIHCAQGDEEGAWRVLEEHQHQAYELNAPQISALIGACKARLWVAAGHFQEATGWARRHGQSLNDAPGSVHEFQTLTLARVQLAEGRGAWGQPRLAELSTWLERLLQVAEVEGRTGSGIELSTLKALALQARGDVAGAEDALLHALDLAAPEGYLRVFVDEGRPMAELLHRVGRSLVADAAPRSRHLVPYVKRLLEAFQPEGSDALPGLPASTAASRPPMPLERLSEREQEVVRLLAAGLSTAEIAGKLVITIGTVRNHLKSIYSKLDAHSRLEAVARARALNLL